MIPRLIASLAWAICMAGCNDAGFQSSSNEAALPLPVSVRCEIDGSYNRDNQEIPVPTDKKSVKLEVTGEFCPQAPANLTVMFLIDFSLSMYNKAESRGNDQLVDGSCGRLDAAKAIIERTQRTTKLLKANVQAGLVGFSTDIVGTIDLKDINKFENDLVPGNFCSGKSRTNYRAAFETAEEMLEDVEGAKVVYFITDGLPSVGGDAPAGLEEEHQTAGKDAAASLRENISNLTLNTVYLGNTFEDIDVDPESVLEDLTGDASRVKIVATADKLAEEILELESPPVELDTTTVKARFENGIDQPIPVEITSFKPSSRDEVWSFETKPFEPFAADEGEPELIIEALGTDGETYKIVFTIIPDKTPSDEEAKE